MMYLLQRSRRPRLLRPARFKERGGRANRRRCARWRRFPSDCRIGTYSDTGNGVLCLNFSGECRSASFASNKRNTAPGGRGGVESSERVGLDGQTAKRLNELVPARLNLEHTRDDNLP